MYAGRMDPRLRPAIPYKLRVAWTHIEAQAFSNEIRSDSDRQAIHGMLVEEVNNLASLERDTVRLQEVLDNLQERRKQSTGRIARLRVGIAPHKQVPPEILLLSKIFVFCADRYVDPTLSYKRSSIWAIAHVCSRWKQIALEEPLLPRRLRSESYFVLQAIVDLTHDIISRRGGQSAIQLIAAPASERDWETILLLISTYPSQRQEL
jgi:hypothetical protein